MISQSVFAAGGGAVVVADGQGVGVAEVVRSGAALEVTEDAVGVVAALVAEAVGVGTAEPDDVEVAVALSAEPVPVGRVGTGEAPLSAAADVATAAARDAAGVADSAEAEVMQGLFRATASVEALSMVLICGAMTSVIPTARATARNPPISAERGRGRRFVVIR
jgi:hypothetical protein